MFKITNNSRVLEVKTNKKNGVSKKSVKVSITNLLSLFVLIVIFSAGFSSCNKYDEQDASIIAFLRTNDLLESKLTKTYNAEIEKVHKDLGQINDVTRMNMLEALVNGTRYEEDYDFDCIRNFVKKYKISDNENTYDTEKLELDISAELWNYLNLTYTNTTPSKAQNTEEGRYYTISELKAKYPDYKEIEIEDFSPMELVNRVMNEKLFKLSMISDGNVNLRTLYVYYLANKPSEKEKGKKLTTEKKQTNELDFLKEYKDKYPSEVNLLKNTIFHNRLKRLLGDRCEFVINNFNIETPIEINDDYFVVKACQEHNCGPTGTGCIIVYNFSNDIMSAGVREKGEVKIYSENDETPLRINEWVENE